MPQNASVKLPADMVIEKERSSFRELLSSNPNYFGNLADSKLKPKMKLIGNTKYEEIACIGFDLKESLLEATIAVKLPQGYGGSLCQNGTLEYVRFYLDYGGGWHDMGCGAVKVHDIPTKKDCAEHPEKPLTYTVSVKIDPKRSVCRSPLLPKVRAILSWVHLPPAGQPNWPPVWGNVMDRHIQIKPKPRFVSEMVAELAEMAQVQIEIPPEYEVVKTIPIPLPDPPELKFAPLARLYQETEKAVPAHRFGFTELHAVMQSPAFSAEMVSAKAEQWKALGLDWFEAVGELAQTKADVSWEELDCLGLEANFGQEQLAATFRIKKESGYAGDLCTGGSKEYVAFWADWEDKCKWTYLGTVEVRLHDFKPLPAGGIHYTARLPVDLTHFRANCESPKIARVRAVLSWAAPPSTVDPDHLNTYGNRLDAHVQIPPGEVIPPGAVVAKISILGGVATSWIDGAGYTLPGAIFASNNLPVDDYNRACPFGKRVTIQGPQYFGYRYRIQVKRPADLIWQDVYTNLVLTNWDGTTYTHTADPDRYFEYRKYEQNIGSLLGLWDTYGDDLWMVKIDVKDPANPMILFPSDTHYIQLDNTLPEASLHIDAGDCSKFAIGVPVTGVFVARDLHFGSYSLYLQPYPGSIAPAAGHVQTAVAPGDTWSLVTKGLISCGYVIRVDVADRSILYSSYGNHNRNSASQGFCLLEKV